jgi:hypothetical protein
MFVNYNTSVVKKFVASLTDDARVIIYDRHLVKVQATGGLFYKHFTHVIYVDIKISSFRLLHTVNGLVKGDPIWSWPCLSGVYELAGS